MDSNNFTASAIAAVVCLHNANAELKGTPKIGVTDVYVVWNCKTLQNNKALLATTVPDGMYYRCRGTLRGSACHGGGTSG